MLSKNGSFESSAKLNGNGGGALWSVGFPGILAVNGMVNGFDFITDGGFDAVTAVNTYTSDFSVDEDGWTTVRGTVAGNIDAIGGENDNLRLTTTTTGSTTRWTLRVPAVFDAVGSCYRVRAKYYIPSGQSNVDGIGLFDSDGALSYTGNLTVLDTWTAIDIIINVVTGTGLFIYPTDGGGILFDDAGGDDVIYLREIIIDKISFTNWTAGTGWAPQVTAGALTGKAHKVASTASNLEQNIGTKRHTSYLLKNEIVRTAGLANPEIGSIDGNIIAVSGTHYDTIITKTTGNLKLQADATFAGNIDNIVGRTQGPLRINGK